MLGLLDVSLKVTSYPGYAQKATWSSVYGPVPDMRRKPPGVVRYGPVQISRVQLLLVTQHRVGHV